MKPIIAKIGIGVLGAGTIGTGVLFATYSNNSYEKYLNEQGRKVLTQDSTKWADLIKKYKEEGNDLLISINGENIDKEEQLKSWCKDNSQKQFTNTNDGTYQRVSAWCTEPKTIIDLIGKNNRALDDKESTSPKNPDDTEWTNKVNEYKKETNKDLIKEIKSEKEETTDIAAKNFSDATKLRAWCKFSKTKHFKHEKDSRFLKYLNWCTISNNKS